MDHGSVSGRASRWRSAESRRSRGRDGGGSVQVLAILEGVLPIVSKTSREGGSRKGSLDSCQPDRRPILIVPSFQRVSSYPGCFGLAKKRRKDRF